MNLETISFPNHLIESYRAQERLRSMHGLLWNRFFGTLHDAWQLNNDNQNILGQNMQW